MNIWGGAFDFLEKKRGNFGHAGRPNLRGGSAPGKHLVKPFALGKTPDLNIYTDLGRNPLESPPFKGKYAMVRGIFNPKTGEIAFVGGGMPHEGLISNYRAKQGLFRSATEIDDWVRMEIAVDSKTYQRTAYFEFRHAGAASRDIEGFQKIDNEKSGMNIVDALAKLRKLRFPSDLRISVDTDKGDSRFLLGKSFEAVHQIIYRLKENK